MSVSDNRVFLLFALLMLVGAGGAALGGSVPLGIALAAIAGAFTVVGLQKNGPSSR